MMSPNLRAIWTLTRHVRGRYAVALLLMLLGTLVIQLTPLTIGVVLDAVLKTSTGELRWPQRVLLSMLGGAESLRTHLWIPALIVAGVTLASITANFFRGREVALASEGSAKRLRENLYDHLQRLPVSWHDQIQTGDVVQRCSSDVDTVKQLFSNQLVEICRAAALLSCAIPMMLLLDWKLALVAVCLLPIIIGFAIVFFGRVQGAFKEADEAEGAMTAMLQENLTGIRVVRAFARQDFEQGKFDARNIRHRELNWKLYKVMATYWASSDMLCLIQTILVLGTATYRVLHGGMSVGTLVSFLLYAQLYIWPVRQTGRVLTELGKALIAMGRIREVLEAPQEKDAAGVRPITAPVRGAIEFANVSFSHRETPVLSDISFRVEPGTTLALVGPSGSGKSTIAHLLLRFYDAASGAITLDGHDISQLPRKFVREQISTVMQEPFLYSRSLNENIRASRRSASDHDVVAAAEAAQVHGNISGFEKQYETIIGERGVTLSGGQRQRVAIARALLSETPILILDDALSAVDTATEARILAALSMRPAKQTALVIAHRLSTLQHADQVLVLDHGKIVQRGTHDSLINETGIYRELWNIQTALEESLRDEVESEVEATAGDLR